MYSIPTTFQKYVSMQELGFLLFSNVMVLTLLPFIFLPDKKSSKLTLTLTQVS